MPALIVVLGTFAIVFAVAALRGFVLTYLWAWFLVPLGLPAIGVAHAMGLALSIGIVGTLLCWGIGYILSSIMA